MTHPLLVRRTGIWALLLPLAVMALGALDACKSEGETVEPPFPIVPTTAQVEQGARVYQANCATCHGDEQGEGRRLGAPPHTSEGHTWHHPDRLLYQWVLDGPPMRTFMPPFRGTLSEEEVAAVLAYIKTFWTEEIRQRQTEGSRQYEEQLKGG